MHYTFLFLLFSLLVSVHSFSQKPIKASSKIKEVQVFFQGAEIKRTCPLSLQDGKNIFEIAGLSSSIDISSLNYSISPSLKVLSIYLEQGSGLLSNADILTKEKLKQQELQKESESLKIKLSDLEEEKKILSQNAVRIGSSQGLNLTELDQTMNYFRKKQEDINSYISKYNDQLFSLNADLSVLTKQIEILEAKAKLSSNTLFITVESEKAQTADIDFSYFVSTCAWAPFYNIYNYTTDQPITLEYKANILNNSGENWSDVNLTLTPANPTSSLELPQMEAWILSYRSKVRGKNRGYSGYNSSGSEGKLNDLQIKNGKQTGDAPLPMREIEIEEGNFVFPIEGKHDIPSSIHAYKVDINKFSKQATYYYQAIPKLESKAYLIAMLTDWEDMKLIEGDANVYSNGNFKGRTYVDPLSAGDTLEISLGPDPGIQITRVKKKDKSRRRLIGLQLVEAMAYEIDIRNLNKNTIFIEITDQIPVGQQADINITLDEKDGAELIENIGKLTWKLEIPPVETAKIKMGYSVRYPRDKVVVIKRSQKLICPSHFW